MSKAGGGMNTVTKIIVWVLVVLLLLGAAGALYYLLSRPATPQGMYIRYGDAVIADSGESIELFSDGGDIAGREGIILLPSRLVYDYDDRAYRFTYKAKLPSVPASATF